MNSKEVTVKYSGIWSVNPHAGMLLTIEGLDGSGQSTQLESVPKALAEKKVKVFLTKEPTDGPFGAPIRSALTHRLKIDRQSLQIGFTADRSDDLNSERGIVPHLEKNNLVIADRYCWSTLAYGYASGLDMDWLTVLQSKFPIPDLTFFLNVPVDVCLERMKQTRFGLDLFETRDTLTKVAEGYKILREKFPDCFTVVNGEDSPENVTKRIMVTTESHPKFASLARK